MTRLSKELEKYLEIEPRARERRARTNGIINVLLDYYPALKQVPKVDLIDFCKDYASLERSWRDILKNNPSLRGQDYDDKENLEQEAQITLGYEPGFKQYKDDEIKE